MRHKGNKTPRRKDGRCSRREALKTGTLASAGAALFPHMAASVPQPAPAAPRAVAETENMHHSMAAYSMRQALTGGAMDLFGFIDWCAELGLAGTELTSYYFPEGFDEAYLHRLRRRAFSNGVTVSGTAVGNNFCLPPGTERRQQIDHVRRWIDHAAKLFAPHIRIFAGDLPEGVSRETGITWVAEGIREALDHAAQQGITLGLENHGSFAGRVDTHLAICEAVGDHPWFGINLDTGNYLGDPYESLARAAPRAVNVQLKAEVRRNDGTRVPVDLERIRKILVEADYKGWIALEYEREDPRKGIPPYVHTLKELF